jgi:hypothetical protein
LYPPCSNQTRLSTHAVHLLLASESWWRRDRVAKGLSPYSAVELDVCLINLSITAKDEDVDALDRRRARVQDEPPSPGDDVARVPDVESSDLVYAVTGVRMAGFNRGKVGLTDRAVGSAGEEVDAVGDLLVVGVGDRLNEAVVGCGQVAVGLLSLAEGVDDSGSLDVIQAAPWTPTTKFGDRIVIVIVIVGDRCGDDCSGSS